METGPTGASKWLLIAGLALLLLAAVVAIMFVMPTPSWLNSESALLIPFAFVIFTVLGLAFVVGGLLIGSATAKRQPRV